MACGALPVVTEVAFLASADENGKAVFARILELARAQSMPIHRGAKGFSLNADVGGTHVAVCFAYPPDSVHQQTLRTTLRGRGGVEKKSAVPEEAVHALWKQAEATGLFVPAGRDLKCHITRKLAESEVDSLLAWCQSVESKIKEHGLKQ